MIQIKENRLDVQTYLSLRKKVNWKELSKEQAKKAFAALPGDEAFTACVNCGACLKKCPQKINIPQEFKKISKELGIS